MGREDATIKFLHAIDCNNDGNVHIIIAINSM